MYEKILPLLICPNCGNKLKLESQIIEKGEIITGELKCNCGKIWKIRSGVIDFEVEEQEKINRWSELTKEMSFEELDEMILSQTPKNQIELINRAKDEIIRYINEKQLKVILDIATGRGLMLNKLIQHVNDGEIHLICTDLSFTVLEADRLKIMKYHPKIKVSFISCDATNLPIIEKGIDLVISLLGITNMEDKIIDGLEEAYRVLKKNENFLNCTLVIKEDSKGYSILKNYFKEKGFKDIAQFFLKNEVINFHSDGGFNQVEFKSVGESIGKKNELDLLPFEGEWFEIGIVIAQKR